MNYREFKEKVVREIMNYMPENYKEMKVFVNDVNKINTKLDGMTIRTEGTCVSPTIYIDYMYDDYKLTNDFERTMRNTAISIVRAMENLPDVNLDMKEFKNNVVFQLINAEANQELLKMVPHRMFCDMAVIYRWLIEMDKNGVQSAIVRNDMADRMCVSEDELYKLAYENTRKILKPSIRNMNDVVKEMMLSNGMPESVAMEMFEEIPLENSMFVISNDRCANGACTIIYNDVLHSLASDLKSDLYILPSSIHETIAVSSNCGNPEELSSMVVDVNSNEVSIEERLSNHVYKYSLENDVVTLATKNTEKLK